MKQPIKITLLVLALALASQVNAQNKLVLTDLQIRTEATDSFEKFADKQANLASDLPVTVALYKDKDLTYYTCFHLTERGKKFRLVNHDFVVYNDKRIKGERQVLKYKKTEGVRGRITGLSEQNIEFNPSLGRSIQVIYRFELVLD